jgi:hypothetical protein
MNTSEKENIESATKEFICVPSWLGISPREKGELNKGNFEGYIKFLTDEKQKFPLNKLGDVNLLKIGKLCNFNRGVFYTNAHYSKRLDEAVKEIGTALVEGVETTTRMDDEMKILRKQLSDKKRDNALADEKIAGQKKQLMEARNEIKRLKKKSSEEKESLQNMIETGRRFTL